MRRSVSFAVMMGCLFALAGCSNEPDRAAPLALDGEDSVSATSPTVGPDDGSSAPTSAAPAAPVTIDQKGHAAVPGRLAVRGADQKAVAQAWLAYWRVRVDAFYRAEVDPAALGEVASDDAADQVVAYVGYLQQNDLHTVGDIALDVSEVKVSQGGASLRSCAINQTTDRQPDGRKAESLNPFFVFLGDLEKSGGTWRVSDVSIYSRSPC